jgi:hypothetical protein
MRVSVHESWQDRLPLDVDDSCVLRNVYVVARANHSDAIVFNNNRAIFDDLIVMHRHDAATDQCSGTGRCCVFGFEANRCHGNKSRRFIFFRCRRIRGD